MVVRRVLFRSATEGKLSVAGPFGKNDKTFRGLYVFNVTAVEEALALVGTDPVVKSGVMVFDLLPWYGSAALMEVNRIHNNIAERSEDRRAGKECVSTGRSGGSPRSVKKN